MEWYLSTVNYFIFAILELNSSLLCTLNLWNYCVTIDQKKIFFTTGPPLYACLKSKLLIRKNNKK